MGMYLSDMQYGVIWLLRLFHNIKEKKMINYKYTKNEYRGRWIVNYITD